MQVSILNPFVLCLLGQSPERGQRHFFKKAWILLLFLLLLLLALLHHGGDIAQELACLPSLVCSFFSDGDIDTDTMNEWHAWIMWWLVASGNPGVPCGAGHYARGYWSLPPHHRESDCRRNYDSLISLRRQIAVTHWSKVMTTNHCFCFASRVEESQKMGRY